MQRPDILNPRADGSAVLAERADSDHAGDVQPEIPALGRRAIRAQPTWADVGLQATDRAHADPGAVSGRRRVSSGRGGADGDTLRPARGRGDIERPNFNLAVPSNGYAWWYVDGLSDDGEKAISIIGFIGSVFSPWYRWSGRKHPENHCCLNVALYGRGARWTMTDRGQSALEQSADILRIGPSSMRWDGDRLVIDINEMATPHCTRIAGQVVVRPSAITDVELPLALDGSHVWRPYAPTADISVDLKRPGWTWTGHGYFDANFGTSALEDDFSYWTWARLPAPGGDGTTCFYDANRRDGSKLAAAVHFERDGTARMIEMPPKALMNRSLWAMRRETRADASYRPHQVKHMLDAPFYNRAAIRTKIHGQECVGVYEALDLNRYRSRLIKPMLAVRVPRRARWP